MSADLLADLRQLRAKTRADRHAYAFLLILFGVLLIVAPLLYSRPAEPDHSIDGWDPRVDGSNILIRIFRTTAGDDPAHPTLIAWYWLLVLVGGFVATLWWYRRHATRVGVATDTQGLVITGVIAFVGFFLGTFALSRYALSLYGAWQLNLSLMFGSLALGALALWRLSGLLRVFVTSLCAAVTFTTIAVYTNKGFSALLVIAGGLLVLTWLECSVQLGVISVLFTMAAVPAVAMINNPTVYLDTSSMFARLGWVASEPRLYAFQQLLLPAAVLLVGGTIAALTARREVTR